MKKITNKSTNFITNQHSEASQLITSTIAMHCQGTTTLLLEYKFEQKFQTSKTKTQIPTKIQIHPQNPKNPNTKKSKLQMKTKIKTKTKIEI